MKDRGAFAGALYGATLYEFRMQVRRRALWITFALFALVLPVHAWTPWDPALGDNPADFLIVAWSLTVQFIHPVAFGLLLADRIPLDRRTGSIELLETLPASPGGRFLGKYLGSTLATLVPLLVTWAAGVAYIVADTGDPAAVPLAAAAFLTVNLPGLLFVAAFSVACPVVLWVPLYQFLFVGYWFWGNLIPLGVPIPTLTRTQLTPLGEYMANGFFWRTSAYRTMDATVLDGAASMGLLLGLATVALACGYGLWRRRNYA